MGTRKISQLETISDANLSGEAILPVVVSDPLIPNRKAKINQLFKTIGQGTKTDPGLAFDLDRNTGLYQNAYDQIGIAFGAGAIYMSRTDDGGNNTSLYLNAIDDTATNTNIVLSPKGTGSVQVTGQFLMGDSNFILEDAQGPKARFEVGNIGTGTATRIFTLPAITAGSGTTLVGGDTQQTLTNKTILIDEDNFVIVDGQEEAIFQINWATTANARRSYFLPDAGAVITTAEPTATSSTLLDTKTVQTVLSKTFVDIKLAPNAEVDTSFVQFNTSNITSNRTITVPDQSLTLVGTEATQVLLNKTFESPIIQSANDATKKIIFNVDNQNTASSQTFEFPETNTLNNGGLNNVFVTERAEQDLRNKTLVSPQLGSTNLDVSSKITLAIDNITANRTIRFPDADATLLSTENITFDDVTFGAGISAANLSGRTRLQQFFYAGF
ncbi:structural protein [Synechococcus phage S-CAM8]|uniref:Structural protein n=1 Tax=Synechococcus phage S-CAM8 TaxID=754038 RepID=R9TLY2_9CAUD|nr:virion structural protein [Synechococcus phage S-CAM8]AGN33868.1 structural protein [Synechococcus phage S-CAM8]